ncbi:General stress protein 69 [Pontiella desulfatans]|uniref:General stress protein 69 n=1 Tax=Pontiella desulfatans TaxID=2750659 RepID=A0A6C2TVW1_PONDE|nr:aldo/keto reductase [Pontiella desulfatans]VGO11800.1 General stress protein 69 [Pontiella desulfatans]
MNLLGKTGLNVMPIGFGGIVVMDSEPKQASRAVADAIEFGINYFDVAPSYGNAEEKLGPALEPFRKDIHLACKTHRRDAKGARETLDQSLEHLKTDYFDVFQLHAITDVEEDVKAAFAKGGAMETILEARKAGIIKHVGFSAHSEAAALAALNEYDFDTVMLPVSFVLHYQKQFESKVLKEAKKRNCGIIALKTLSSNKRPEGQAPLKYKKCWYEPIDDPGLAELAMCWTLSQGVSLAVSPGEEVLLRMMMDLYPKLHKLTESEMETLKAYAAPQVPIF